MTDYSATPLPKKLGIEDGARVAVLGAPKTFERTLGPLPPSVSMRQSARGPLDVIVFFTSKTSELERRFSKLAGALEPAGGLWIAYPKKSSGVGSDLTFERVQDIGLRAGLVDNKSCAIDETWSGVRFVYRLKDRKARRRSPP